MPSITETMRSAVPESSGRRDARTEKTATPSTEAEATTSVSESKADQVELSDSVMR